MSSHSDSDDAGYLPRPSSDSDSDDARYLPRSRLRSHAYPEIGADNAPLVAVKYRKSGFLMSVIRTLSASETNEQREKEKAKLEKEYKKSDQRLDELVSAHSSELTQVMQIFSSVCGAVTTCRSRLRATKARLTACRGLLRVRRDDLRRLWADARRHKYALDMLVQVEQLVGVDKAVSEHMSRGNYLNAATVLQSALMLAGTDLAEVDALVHLRSDLENKKKTLVERTTQAMTEAVYTHDIGPALKRQGSSRERTQANMLSLVISDLTKNDKLLDETLQEVTPELELSLVEEERSLKISLAILIESLAVLDQVKESTENLKVQIQTELLQIINTVSQQVIDFGVSQLTVVNGPTSSDVSLDLDKSLDAEEQNADPQYQLLVELLTSLLEAYRLVAQRQRLLLELWRQTLVKHKKHNVQLYSMQHYWNSVQAVLQLLLTDYLDIQNLTLTSQRTTFTEQVTSADLSSFFTKKKQSKKKTRLFKFGQSSVAESKAQSVTHSLEALSSRGKTYQLVCRPNPENLSYVYHILEMFMNEIETNTGSKECSLRAFITDHIRNAEVERLASVTKVAIEAAMKEPGAWREIGPPPKNASGVAPNIMIFTCCRTSWVACERVCSGARRLGSAGADSTLRGALTTSCAALMAHARAAYNHAAPPARASKWLADDDIVRFLKSLPNWHALKNPPKRKSHSDQDMKQSYEREAEILGSSLGDGTVSHKEIISNTNTLREVAVMCQTMDWLSNCIRAIATNLNSPNGTSVKLSEKTLSDIGSAAVMFEDLSDTCLLLLHLELRIQCFHYLGQEDSGGSLDFNSDTGDLSSESGAARLAAAMLTFYEDASPIMHRTKLNYIMCGIGEMMSAGVVWRCRGDTRGASTQSTRLATLRHCLAALSLPSDGLHRAALYLDLLTMTPEEILTVVKDKGPQFSELEYLNAFNIIGKSKQYSEAEIKMYLNKLSNILGNVGVTV